MRTKYRFQLILLLIIICACIQWGCDDRIDEERKAKWLKEYEQCTLDPQCRIERFMDLYEYSDTHDTLIRMLKIGGTPALAEAFLNASLELKPAGGNFYEAGTKWASAHGCTIMYKHRIRGNEPLRYYIKNCTPPAGKLTKAMKKAWHPHTREK